MLAYLPISIGALSFHFNKMIIVGSFYADKSASVLFSGAGMVMRAIIEESDVETSKAMQMLALTEGAFLTHLRLALLTTGKDLEVSMRVRSYFLA